MLLSWTDCRRFGRTLSGAAVAATRPRYQDRVLLPREHDHCFAGMTTTGFTTAEFPRCRSPHVL